MADPDGMLFRQNYSESTLKIVDRHLHRTRDDYTTYQLRYPDKKPSRWFHHPVKWYNQAKYYFDPMSDDTNFGRREITFDNKFYYDRPVKKEHPPTVVIDRL
jgi:hypothetical protein